MINRIREIRRAKGLTLADLAAACDPPTTAQTIGRLETGTRTLSINWMDRIGKALNVDPPMLVRSEKMPRAKVIAEFDAGTIEPLRTAREAILPTELAVREEQAAMIILEVTAPAGEYRAGDTVWLRRHDFTTADGASADASDDTANSLNQALSRAVNRDCLVPRSGGRFVFGRLIDRAGSRLGILPAQTGVKQQVIDGPEWIGIATMLVRAL